MQVNRISSRGTYWKLVTIHYFLDLQNALLLMVILCGAAGSWTEGLGLVGRRSESLGSTNDKCISKSADYESRKFIVSSFQLE